MTHLLWHYLTNSAERFPERLAVQCAQARLTYAELNQISDNICAALLARDIGPGKRIGLYMPKSCMGPSAMAGILKAGGVYVPVDPSAPGERAGFVLRDCAVSALITSQHCLAQLGETVATLPQLELIVLVDGDETLLPAGPNAPQVITWRRFTEPQRRRLSTHQQLQTDPAYILYTSGSTGRPKGVVLSHGNAVAFVDWAVETIGVETRDKLSNHAPFHFDLSVFDLYGAFKSGASVALVPDKIAPFPSALAKWIAAEAISIWYSTPSALTRMVLHGGLEEADIGSLRAVLYAGEPFPVKHLRKTMSALPKARFFNLYGPTETNVCTYFELPRTLPPETRDVPIGAACANTEVFALRDDGQVAHAGEEGELFVAGATVMQGYWGLPDETSAALIQDPRHDAPSLMYRTGDIVRLGADGFFTFLGRRDSMVKSRGYRIELGEIEQTLLAHPDVSEAVVIAVSDEEVGATLHAVAVLYKGANVSVNDLQHFCRRKLPRYMVPEAIRIEADLPKTSTGKTDRLAIRQSFTHPTNEQST